MTINTQRVSSVVRQVLAIAAIVIAAISTASTSIHLPPIGSAILGIVGTAILAIEHYVSDPSTGTPSTPPPPTP